MVNVGQAVGYLMLDTKGWASGFASAKKDLQTFSNQTSTFNDKMTSASSLLNKAGMGMTKGLTLPIIGIGAATVKTAADFESAMSTVAATTGMAVSEMGGLKDAAIEAGMKTKYSALEAADALNLLGQAGYDQAQMIAALPHVLNLAAAGDIEMAMSAEILTNALNALGMTSSDTGILMGNLQLMVDQFAVAAAASSVEVADMGEAVITAGGILKNLNGGLSETNLLLAIFGDNGIKGAKAGTHLRNIILAMTPTTTDAAAAWEELGVKAYDSSGNLKEMRVVFDELGVAMANMTQEEKINIISRIFNKTDIAAVQALLGTTEEKWTSLTDKINDSTGAAQQMMETRMDNLAGAIETLGSSLESIMITLGEELMPIVKDVAQWLQNLLDKFEALTPEQRKNIVTIGLIVAAIGPFLLILAKLVTAIKLVGAAMAFLAANPVVLLIAGIVALVAAVIYVVKYIVEHFQELKQKTIAIWNAIENFLKGIWNSIKNVATSVFNAVKNFFANIWNAIKSTAVNTWEGLKSSISSIWDATVNWISTGVSNILGFFTSLPSKLWQAGKDAILSFWNGLKSIWEKVKAWFKDSFGWIIDLVNTVGGWFGFNKKSEAMSHSMGLDYVPYDNYYARLHKGERVLTAQENKAYASGVGGQNSSGATYNFFSPKALDPVTAKQLFETARKQEALGINLG